VEKPFVTESSRSARCAPHDVIDVILDSTTWPAWQPEIISARGPSRLDPGGVVEGRARMLGFGVTGRSTAVDVSDSVFEEEVIVGVTMRLRFDVRPSPEGSVIIQRLTAELPKGFAGRLLGLLLRWRLRRMQRVALERLAAQAEGASVS
jgi:hypothetical protein